MLGQRRRLWANIKPALGERLLFAGYTVGMGVIRTLALLRPNSPQKRTS